MVVGGGGGRQTLQDDELQDRAETHEHWLYLGFEQQFLQSFSFTLGNPFVFAD